MFGISIPELIIVVAVALIVLGPERLPKTMHTVGRWLGLMKRTADNVRREFYNSVYTPASELKGGVDLVNRELRTVAREIEVIPKHPLCPDTQREEAAKRAAQAVSEKPGDEPKS